MGRNRTATETVLDHSYTLHDHDHTFCTLSPLTLGHTSLLWYRLCNHRWAVMSHTARNSYLFEAPMVKSGGMECHRCGCTISPFQCSWRFCWIDAFASGQRYLVRWVYSVVIRGRCLITPPKRFRWKSIGILVWWAILRVAPALWWGVGSVGSFSATGCQSRRLRMLAPAVYGKPFPYLHHSCILGLASINELTRHHVFTC